MVGVVIDVVVIGDYVIVGLFVSSFVTINVIATASFTVSDRTQMIAGLQIRLLSLVVWRKPSICRGNVLLD